MNILIVDDQPNVLASLATTIDWETIGIGEVYTAGSTLSAKSILLDKQIHILLTDIEMPIENGLKLIRWIRDQQLPVECILITSHTDFLYAKQGIDLGVIDYVVQPAKSESILRAVKNAIEKISSRNTMLQELQAGRFSNYEINSASRHFLKTWPQNDGSPEFETQLGEKIQRLNDLGIHCSQEDSCAFFLTNVEEWTSLPLSEFQLRNAYNEIVQSVFSFVNGSATTYYEDGSHLFTLLTTPFAEELEPYFKIIQQRAREFLHCSVSIYYCCVSFRELLPAFQLIAGMEYLNESDPTPRVERLYLSAEKKNLDQASQHFREYYEKIVSYIQLHISEPISRQAISESIHISPDYISHIVRSIAECSCKELITHEKMKCARSMIENTSQSIGNIAAACGYDSFAYFSKVYKATYGVSPRRDRK